MTNSPTRTGKRPDIQGLRAVAVGLVIADHVFHRPHGGYVGVDIFFVISGYLITSQLLKQQTDGGRISFRRFYTHRARRILPMSIFVAAVTVALSYAIFFPSRANQSAIDALFSMVFAINWKFATAGVDYFSPIGYQSPFQHYWSLAVEEQFYLFWPLAIVLVVMIDRRAGQSRRRQWLTPGLITAIAAASFLLAIYQTASNSNFAYFATSSRVFEFATGAVLATVPSATREKIISHRLGSPLCSALLVGGLALVAFSAVETAAGSSRFPGPLAALPVMGTAAVIASGFGSPAAFLTRVLDNRVMTYVGNISYSLYLWHWPIVVFVTASCSPTLPVQAAMLVTTLALSAWSFRFVEEPFRKLGKKTYTDIKGPPSSPRLLVSAVVAALVLSSSFLVYTAHSRPESASASAQSGFATAVSGTALKSLQGEITSAADATRWPPFDSAVDRMIRNGEQVPSRFIECGDVVALPVADCTFGTASAPRTIVLVGDSIAMTFARPLERFADASDGRWKVQVRSMFGCPFVDIQTRDPSSAIGAACPHRIDDNIELIRREKPDAVMIVNSDQFPQYSQQAWERGVRRLTDRIAPDTGRLLLASPPPADVAIASCYARVNSPNTCASRVSTRWAERAAADRGLMETYHDGQYLDTRPLFCTAQGICPAFVGKTPTKIDLVHMSPAYATEISPAFAEMLADAGLR
ncbi:acyltransferase family protein [uncultured Williamsia sp.]|uniref:acyltransferase family protein n=1 Tax=uncultured Williamsia sp. TaxID=259311 RepID=UPI0026181743|nr:acyltransferase family protein [uncultured Williamsia sp.]